MATGVISLVVGVGAQMLSSLFKPKQKDTYTFGPRVSDMNVPTVSPGNEIPRAWGLMKLNGQVIWSSLLIETQHIAAQQVPGGKGGGKGGSSYSYTISYTYSVNYALGFCRGPIVQFNRIWAGAKLLWINPNQVGFEQTEFDDAYQSEASRLLDLGVPPEQACVSAYMFAFNNYEATASNTIWNVNPATSYIMSHPITGYPQTDNLNFATVYSLVLQMYDPVQWNQNFIPTVIRYDSIVQYVGDELQYPDPTIEAAIGASYVSGYRGLAYVVINNLQLADFGNMVPQVSAEVMIDGTVTYSQTGPASSAATMNAWLLYLATNPGQFGTTTSELALLGFVDEAGNPLSVGTLAQTYISAATANQVPLITILNDILQESALTPDEFDVSTAIPGSLMVDGYAVSQVTSTRSLLQDLQKIFQFDGCETGNKIKFQMFNRRAVMILDTADFATHVDSEDIPYSVQMVRGSELDMPRRLNFRYQEQARNFCINTVWAERWTGNSLMVEDIDLSIAVGRDVAKTQIEAAMVQRFMMRNTYKVKLPRKYIILEPGDVVLRPNPDFYGAHDAWRCYGTTIGANGIIEADFHDADYTIGDLAAITGSVGGSGGDGGSTPPVLTQSSRTIGYCLDIPIPSDLIPDGPQFFTVITGVAAGWRSGGLLVDLNNPGLASAYGASASPTSSGPSWFSIANGGTRVPCGFATQSLDTTVKPGTWDYKSEVIVYLFDPSWVLSNANQTDMMTQALNTVVIGGEICAFASAENLSNGNWLLTKWMRGLRGTETQIANHKAGENFVWLSADSSEIVNVTASTLGKSATYCAITSGATLDTTTEFQFANTGNALRPYAPAVTDVYMDESNNFTVNWQPRNRLNGAWVDGQDITLDQSVESYSIDVFTIVAGSPVIHATYDLGAVRTWAYAASAQVSDTGISGAGVFLNLYQIGAVIGRGFATQIAL